MRHSSKKLVVTYDACVCQRTDNEWIGVNDTAGPRKKTFVALVNHSRTGQKVTRLVNTTP